MTPEIADRLVALAAEALIVVLPLLGAYAGRLIHRALASLRADDAERVVRVAVAAAESVGRARGLAGAEKYAEAAGYARRELRRRGVRLSDEQLDRLIEAGCEQLRQVGAATRPAPKRRRKPEAAA